MAALGQSGLLHAQEMLPEDEGFVASAMLGLKHDSNVQRNALGDSDTSLVLSPELIYGNYIGKHLLYTKYSGEYARFSDYDSLDFENHSVDVEAYFDYSLRFSSILSMNYQNGVEDPSQTNNLVSEFDEFTEFEKITLGGSLLYGTRQSVGQIVVSAEAQTAEFKNNDQSFRDFDSVGGSAEFFYRLAPNTRMLFEVSLYDFDYDQPQTGFDQSSQQISYLTGIQWRYSEQLESTVRIGYQTKDFDEASQQDISGLSFGAELSWAPSELTRVKLGSARNANESAIADLAGLVTTSFDLGVEHEITERFELFANYRYANDDFDTRKDISHFITIGFEFDFREWLEIDLEYSYSERESDFNNFSYDANVVMLSFEVEMD